LNLSLYGINSTNFTFLPGNSYNLTISYDINRTFTIETSNKDVFTSYIDLMISSERFLKRKTDVFTIG
jgi:hypothetical protein